MKFQTFDQSLDFLYNSIPTSNKGKFPGQTGLDRAKKLLIALGNPQEKIKVIHIAGTSGKGSTAYIISHILTNLGFKTGLSLSPHLIDIRERCQINNELISKNKFVEYLNKIRPVVEEYKPTYFEILIALAFYVFYKEKVDYAVIETGMGGIYDGSNVVSNKDKVCVLTKIGLDHTKVLGNTIEEIAVQKCGIIQSGNTVLSTVQKPSVKKIIEETCKNKKCELIFLDKIVDVKSSLVGEYQKENISLALKVISELSKKNEFILDVQKINNALMNAHFPGRFDIIKKDDKTIILDGAHNPQKMQAFISSLTKEFPNKKFDFMVAFKKGKDYKVMLDLIIPVATSITVTSFFSDKQDLVHLSEDTTKIKEYIKDKIKTTVIENSKKALDSIESDFIVVTGSLYLLGEIKIKSK